MDKRCGVVMHDKTVCERPVHAQGLCGLHLSRLKQGTEMGKPFGPQTKQIKPCRICGTPAPYADLCSPHRERARRGVSLDPPILYHGRTDAEKVEKLLWLASPAGDCLIASRLGHDGYATHIKDENGEGIASYRLVYRVVNGPIPKGEQIHHKCANRACINPDHLVAATQKANVGEMLARLSYERRIANLEAEIAELKEKAQ